MSWTCENQNCGAKFSEYVNGCPKCYEGSLGRGLAPLKFSVREDAMNEQRGPHEAGQVTPEMETAYRASITVTLTATRTVEFLVEGVNRAVARRIFEEKAGDLIAIYKAETKIPWTAIDNWDSEIELEGRR